MASVVVKATTPEQHLRTAQVGQMRIVFKRLFKSRMTWPGLIVLVLVGVMAATADWLAPYDPIYQNYGAVLSSPSSQNPLGTDDLGRDVLSNIIYGSRVSLQVGVVSAGLALMMGVVIGIISGYWGGWLDDVLMRITDAVYSFPTLVLALAITAVLGPSLMNVMIAVAVTQVPSFARLARGQVLTVRERDYVMAARVIGATHARIMRVCIGPNIAAPLIVQASLAMASAILSEAALSFLGMGAPPPTPSWGAMLRNGYGYLEYAPWMSIFPGLAIFLTVLALNFMGDGLRNALDPRMSKRGDL